ncbi:hypothetical protein MUP77_08985 [Candidatus Bathyarchaeota archaeon]|nr:hypothetical protein [Candidatus Bathyarchaeota archaeon]
MKRTALALTLISALSISILAGVCLVNLAVANPYEGPPLSDTPDTSPPSIIINDLENYKTYNVKTVPYSLTVVKPSSWFKESSPLGRLVSVDCIIDGSQKVNIANSGALDSEYNNPEAARLKGNLPELSEGKHTIQFSVESVSYYLSPDRDTSYFGFWKALDFPDKYYQSTYSNEVSFITDTTPPSISILSIENKTYFTAEVPLNFAVSEPTSGITYCLDNMSNVTIAGNSTLTGLSNGSHDLTAYAWDTAGNIGASGTIKFTIAQETEFQSPKPFPTTLVIASIASVAAIGLGLLVYFKKRKR